jgi:hypothetical protein
MVSRPLTNDIADEWYEDDLGGTGTFELESDVDEVIEDDYSDHEVDEI